jgi:hypothetical protein
MPSSANFLTQILHIEKNLINARGLPHCLQRLRALVENLGFLLAFSIIAFLAIIHPYRLALNILKRHVELLQKL